MAIMEEEEVVVIMVIMELEVVVQVLLGVMGVVFFRGNSGVRQMLSKTQQSELIP